MNKLAQIGKSAKLLKALISYIVIISCLIISIADCTKVVVQPTPVSATTTPEVMPETPVPIPAPEPPAPPAPEYKPAPTITSIRQSSPVNGTFTITINGSGFDSGAVVQIYNSSGKHIGSGILSGKLKSRTSTQIVVAGTTKGVRTGKYTVKVKNPDGQYSNPAVLTIPEAQKPILATPKPDQCSGSLSKKPSILYLGGGEAEKLFERYLAQNSEAENKLPYSLKIKFYEKEKDKTDLILQTVELGNAASLYMEQMFVESRTDFLNKIKKLLNGRVAEPYVTLAEDASRENADYFQCPAK